MIDIVDEVTLLLAFPSSNIVINTDDNHYKFYTYTTDNNQLVFHYGAIGKAIRSIVEYSNINQDQAIRYGNQKLKQKIKSRGYSPLNFKLEDIK